MSEPYDADYFLRGKESGKSLYTDYRWLPDLTLPMCKAIAEHMGMKPPASILDYGCARGYLVKAFRELKFEAMGVDISKWAIENCDPEIRSFVSNDLTQLLPVRYVDYVIAKDVLEHIPEDQLKTTISFLYSVMRRGMLVVVPLAPRMHSPYVVPEYEQDVTHRIRMNLADWYDLLSELGGNRWDVIASYRMPGVKDNYFDTHPKGNGFFKIIEKV